jgi:hypothetical protein
MAALLGGLAHRVQAIVVIEAGVAPPDDRGRGPPLPCSARTEITLRKYAAFRRCL